MLNVDSFIFVEALHLKGNLSRVYICLLFQIEVLHVDVSGVSLFRCNSSRTLVRAGSPSHCGVYVHQMAVGAAMIEASLLALEDGI